KADLLADTMILGKKLIKDGDYAILQTISDDFEISKIEYFKRTDNKWIFNEEVTNNKLNNDISINNKVCQPPPS